MTTHTSASAQETPHETETTATPISDALRRHAELVINDNSIDPQWRTIIRFALELNDPGIADLLGRAMAGEDIVDTFESLQTPDEDELVSRVVEIHLAHPRWSSLHSFVSGGDSDRVRFVL